MRQAFELLIAAILGAAVMFVATHGLADSTGPRSTHAVVVTADTEMVAPETELATQAVEELWGYRPETACPREVPEIVGYTFRCESLVKGVGLIPVTIKVISPLGFMRVQRVGQPTH